MTPRRLERFSSWFLANSLFVFALALTTVGCATPLFRGQTPEPEELVNSSTEAVVKDIILVGDVANGSGMHYQEVQSIALVTGLDDTGSDPPPGPQRQLLLDEMKTHDVKDPNKLLADPSTSMVLVKALLPPAAKKGDRVDIEVRVPARSETKSLRGGWLMQSRLKEMQVLGGTLKQGHVIGLAEGTVLVDAAFTESQDQVLMTRGRVLGGGVSHISRNIGLVVRPDESSIRTSTLIGSAINNRFHTFDHGKKVGAATPKKDNFVELSVPPRYQHNVWRYMRVVRAIALQETPSALMTRLKVLEQKLGEPTTAGETAVQLEAIGKEAIPVLKRGLTSTSPEVRFHSAEALAYLDESDAAAALAEAAKGNSAFRWAAEMALASMDHVSAYDALNDLLHVSSAEARYGAFRSIRLRNPRDPLVRGELLGEDKVSFQVVNTTAETMVHFSKSQRPEIVLFGADQKIKPPIFLYAGKRILIKGIDHDRLKLIRYTPGKTEESETCSNELQHLIPLIFKLGGNYTDVMQCLLAAKKDNYLESRIAIDALPKPGRVYFREEAQTDGSSDSQDSNDNLGRPGRSTEPNASGRYEPDINRTDEEPKKKTFYERMWDWR